MVLLIKRAAISSVGVCCISIYESTKTEAEFGISSYEELYAAILASCESVDFDKKSKDFEKLVFDQTEKKKVLLFPAFIRQRI